MQVNPAVQSYVIEARDLLAQLETMLLDLEQAAPPEAVDSVFRALHTLKGGGGMFGFPALSAFVHHFEDAFDLVRMGKISVTRPLLDAALAGRDHVIALLDAGGDPERTDALANSPEAASILSQLARAANLAPPPVAPAERGWMVHFRPAANALMHGMRPDLLLEELASLGQCEVKCLAQGLAPLATLDPTQSHLGWDVTLHTTQGRAAIEAVFIFAEDAELTITEIAPPEVETKAEGPAQVRSTAPSRAQHNPETVRVPSLKLDAILDQLGELVIAQARLNQIASRFGDSTLDGLVEEFQRLIGGLRDTTLAIRMLPIETVFGKFRRVVRDLSVELGKEVILETEGGETEIDKNVLDRLSEPLVHMIRNSVDHGIESTAERVAAGKPAQGLVRLAACQDAGEILITIEDDGKGLDHERIRQKAIERGILAPEATPTESQLAELIFAPGFSTAEKVSSVSGRGVGMDAVMTTISALRGSVEVMSRKGEGTLISLRLPLTLAIIDGLLVQLGGDIFVMPLIAVDECVEFDLTELKRDSGRTMLAIRDEMVPFVDLAHVFGVPVDGVARRRVVIVRAEGQRMGLVVDDILGQHQTVIKPMSPFHADLADFAGATILGDGTVALILDTTSLLRRLLDSPSQALAA
ncbi:chemotaxis protein CheA [Stagnihabitans tardus]|uniref:Chemotaxis protein CheA n=1 Tax=Stagnihabitans tardus TaxID=2699202 RepID=A0AAE5BRL7_9RHOB|nr:chemotaxis protein CheA [Stagnihabitans tardus]NBZ86720.1 chemotaxis protein CheA [Stagnihabitans tardus]